eukprot:1280048-Rhodomonas_salina.2
MLLPYRTTVLVLPFLVAAYALLRQARYRPTVCCYQVARILDASTGAGTSSTEIADASTNVEVIGLRAPYAVSGTDVQRRLQWRGARDAGESSQLPALAPRKRCRSAPPFMEAALQYMEAVLLFMEAASLDLARTANAHCGKLLQFTAALLVYSWRQRLRLW